VGGHEDTSTTLLAGTLTTQTSDLAILINLVEFEDSKLDLLLLMLGLLGGGVVLLLALLGTTTQTQHQMESGLLLDVVVAQRAPILKLLASKDQTLLVWGDSLLVLDLGLDIFDSVRGLHLKGDGLSRQSLDENLHGCCLVT